MSSRILKNSFTSSSKVFSELKEYNNQLIFLFFGVSFLLPIQSSIIAFKEFISQYGVQGYILNQEEERSLVQDRNVVVGTPYLEIYYNEKLIPFVIVENGESPMTYLNNIDSGPGLGSGIGSGKGLSSKDASASSKDIHKSNDSRKKNENSSLGKSQNQNQNSYKSTVNTRKNSIKETNAVTTSHRFRFSSFDDTDDDIINDEAESDEEGNKKSYENFDSNPKFSNVVELKGFPENKTNPIYIGQLNYDLLGYLYEQAKKTISDRQETITLSSPILNYFRGVYSDMDNIVSQPLPYDQSELGLGLLESKNSDKRDIKNSTYVSKANERTHINGGESDSDESDTDEGESSGEDSSETDNDDSSS